ncbi:unnamed protein product [Periconia digitata]|uniref:Uncharacterized protein n=1 Tax=Periconia digitata TaxID=1303443 RepID=A0A9W4UCG9_9PLEO|nr:unnamed protein product [Periconia digitata]
MLNDVYPLVERGSGGDELNGVYPLYPVALIVPTLAFPAFILCIPPMMWHFTQRNIAAGSLMLWLILINFFNAINPLIWPRDNMEDWWNGQGLCDIQARVQVGAVIAWTNCAGVIARRLANVMDTSNITVAPSKNHWILERSIEIVFCWILPILLMIVYYIVQRMRYFIFGISGCVAAYDPSWASIVFVWMWGPISTLVASYYAGLLIFRLYRYRREFHRLIAARNTSKSRFIRLFLLSVIILIVVLPYYTYILCDLSKLATVGFDWDRVHGSDWNSVVKVPSHGRLRMDRWAEIILGYVLFLLFGTGTDAHNSYKRMLVSMGLGRVFPRLLVIQESTSTSPSTMTFVKGWTTSWSTKAKGVFSKNGTVNETLVSDTRRSSSMAGTPGTVRSGSLHPVSINDPMLPSPPESSKQSLFSRLFRSKKVRPTLLPISVVSSIQPPQMGKSPVDSIPPGVHARAWSNEGSTNGMMEESDGVQVMREIRQAHEEKRKSAKTDPSEWA